MGSFIADNIINIILGVATVVTSAIAIRYKQLEHELNVERVIDQGRRAGLFLSRDAMIRYLLEMHDRAALGDVIWAQCVRCKLLVVHGPYVV